MRRLINNIGRILVVLLLVGSSSICISQILTFENSALAGGEATATSNFNNANLTTSTLSRGGGLAAGGNAGRYNATSWSTSASLSTTDYMEFTITPNAGFQFSITSIVMNFQRSGTGPKAFAIRSSVDGYAADLATQTISDVTSTQTLTFTFAQTSACATAITYRFYGYNAESTGGSGGIGDGGGNDLIVNGSVPSCGGGGSFTVVFDGNTNDSGSMSDQTASTPTALTSNSYGKAGCTFSEWNTVADGSGTSYADAATYDFSADVTLFAIWNCGGGGSCANEEFDGAGNSATYSTINWTGDDGVDWTATDARGDQDLNGSEALLLRNGSLTNDVSFPNGCGVLEFDYARVYADNSTLQVFVNGVQYGGDITVSLTTSTHFSVVVNATGPIDVELRNSGNRTLIDKLEWTCFACTAATEPVSQASGITFSAVTCSSMTVSWTRPGGNDGCIVVIRAASDVTATPTDAIFNSASPIYGLGDDIGTSEFVIYTGTASTVNIQGLTSSTTYYVNVFEYNGAAECVDYLTTGEPTNNQSTTACIDLSITSISPASPYSVSCGALTPIDITIGGTGTFNNPNNNYIVELSDASGSFASPDTILRIKDELNPTTFTAHFPSDIPTGTGYRIRIKSTDIAYTSDDNGSDLTINQSGTGSGTRMTGVMINACVGTGNPCGKEGYQEVLFFQSGADPITVSAANIDVGYSSVDPPANDYVTGIVSNTPTTNALNTASTCSPLFEDANSVGTIPANSSFIVVNENLCVNAIDWSSLCYLGTIYVVYATNVAPWTDLGNFANSLNCSGGVRFFNSSITDASGTTNVEYSFDCASHHSDSDGDYIGFGDCSGPATIYDNSGCAFSNVIGTLPVELLLFTGEHLDNENILNWTTKTEENNEGFYVQHSTDGFHFETIGFVHGAGNSFSQKHYVFIDKDYSEGNNYYRLEQLDYNGDRGTHPIIVINNADLHFEIINWTSFNNEVFVNLSGVTITAPLELELFDYLGRSIKNKVLKPNNRVSVPVQDISNGIYLLRVKQGSNVSITKIKL